MYGQSGLEASGREGNLKPTGEKLDKRNLCRGVHTGTWKPGAAGWVQPNRKHHWQPCPAGKADSIQHAHIKMWVCIKTDLFLPHDLVDSNIAGSGKKSFTQKHSFFFLFIHFEGFGTFSFFCSVFFLLFLICSFLLLWPNSINFFYSRIKSFIHFSLLLHIFIFQILLFPLSRSLPTLFTSNTIKPY